MRKGLKSLLLLIVSVGFLAACAGTTDTTKDDSAVSGSGTGSDSSSSSSDAMTSGTGSGSAWAGHALDDPDSLLSKRTVYFDFDESVVLDADGPILEASRPVSIAESRCQRYPGRAHRRTAAPESTIWPSASSEPSTCDSS